MFIDKHLTVFDFGDFGIGNPLNMAMTHFGFQHALRIANPPQSQMTDIRLTGDISHRHFITTFRPTQGGINNHRIFIGRTKTTRALNSPNNHWTRIIQQLLIPFISLFCMVYGANRMSKTIKRSGTLHLLKSQLRPCGNDQVIVINSFPICQHYTIFISIDLASRLSNEINSFAFQCRLNGKGNVLALTPTYTNPRIRRDKLKIL
ncbi:hypothetical protein THIOM_001182 [Candidatus Thiomargarita nelsonii]|uniref:Uncharacterized protein n=1 Tax=Candidatus Thiomargarita nelsonii TaxID=1003181 RepID=A0A176S4X8_9GAMM|nr:hypothetical protein THIOM_001182 [Candidatus Thiomargarita nelsonii]